MDEIVEAVERIRADLETHSAAARAIARAYFSHEVVLGDLLSALGLPRFGRRTSIPDLLDLTPESRRPLVLSRETIDAAAGLPSYSGPSTVAGPDAATIVIVTFDNLAISKLCLETILAHTPAGRYELIVVDNASTDGTREHILDLDDRHPHVRVIANPTNVGFAAACNRESAPVPGMTSCCSTTMSCCRPAGWTASSCGSATRPSGRWGR